MEIEIKRTDAIFPLVALLRKTKMTQDIMRLVTE